MLLERFGEPIGNAPTTVGVPDEKKGAEASCCDRCGSMPREMDSACECGGMREDDLVQKAPPGLEKQVKALKNDKDIDNPWAVSWAQYNKKH